MRNAIIVCLICAPLSGHLSAQWLNYPTPGIPRLPDGKPNLAAPAPKTADGKPDLSGTWMTRGGYTVNIAKDLKPGEVSFQPWAETLYKHRLANDGKEDPQGRCVLSGVPREDVVPYPFKILNTNGPIVILYEALHSYRQIFMDGRALPKDPHPAWNGSHASDGTISPPRFWTHRCCNHDRRSEGLHQTVGRESSVQLHRY